MSDDLPEVQSALAEQAGEIIDKDTDWVELAKNLDVDRYRGRDNHPEWCSGAPFRPMFLAYLWATVEDESLTGIPERLEGNPELARAFGFDLEELPSSSTCRPVRLEDRFKDLQATINRAADEIQQVSAERGSPIGYQLGKQNTDAGDPGPPSKRTIQRLVRKRGNQVLGETESIATSSLTLPRPDGAIYDEDELLLMEAIAALKQEAANCGGQSFGDSKNPDPDIAAPYSHEGSEDGDPFYADGPSGETLLEAIHELSVDEIADMMNYALRKTYTRAKPKLRELEPDNGFRFGTRAKVALDITYVAYYGDREKMKWVQGAPDDKGYDWCHKFATAVIVGENTHYIVGVCPLGSTEYADTEEYAGQDRSYYVGDVARRLLSIADDYVNIRMVYGDREFCATDVIHTLNEKGLDYIIPAVQDQHRIGPMCDNFDQLKRGYDEENDTPLYVKNDHPMHGRVKHGSLNEKVYTNVVILPPDEDDDTHEEGSPQPFLTSLSVSDEIALDRKWATEQVEEYSDRGAIENSYSSVKKTCAWTTSREIEVRWFHFAFGCIVYNMWLLVDFLTQERIGVIETRKKPRIQLSRFLDWLDDLLDTWIQEGLEVVTLR
ncbi:transposase [Halorubrum sp. Eb13]|uniref:transposase n=1 Tax=Halorubrum sp. Eb13 TaxID=1383843 RepID=UPI000B9963DA|nr:transposase [Halorubrum sp. Eb13]OYR48429.1 transposase [Halorubrum sp. Eb13]